MKKGLLIVLSGPSGVGKGTVRQYFMDLLELNLAYSISMTTRNKREGETEGKDYFFVSKDEFNHAVKKGELLEYAEFVGNCYGTPKAYVERLREEGKNVILEIEVDGATQVLEKAPEALSIFIIPPSLEELEKRIRGRRSESDEVIQKRLEKAERELKLIGHYKYVVCNEDPKLAAHHVATIIKNHIDIE
jgi:guanylate kinase